MVSGFFTSPCDQERMVSGEASEIRMESKTLTSIIIIPLQSLRGMNANIESDRLQFLNEYFERFGNAGFGDIESLDDSLVSLDAPEYVVRFDVRIPFNRYAE